MRLVLDSTGIAFTVYGDVCPHSEWLESNNGCRQITELALALSKAQFFHAEIAHSRLPPQGPASLQHPRRQSLEPR